MTSEKDEPEPEVSEATIARGVFNLNQSHFLCLPLVSDNQKLIWVHCNHTDLQLDGVAELEKAFDTFPYLTEKQTSVLAQRCSLHPDQVKVWFMQQRLRYGISWDYGDILQVWKKVQPNQRNEKSQNGEGDATSKARHEIGQKKTNIRADGNKQLKRKIQLEKMAKKGKKLQRSTRAVDAKASFQQWLPDLSYLVPNEENLCADFISNVIGGEYKLEPSKENSPNVFPRSQKSSGSRPFDLIHPLPCNAKAIMRAAFCYSQYPTRGGYDKLVLMTGVPRHELVHWFSDTRYYIKKQRPHWMSQEQHRRALGNVMNHQGTSCRK